MTPEGGPIRPPPATTRRPSPFGFNRPSARSFHAKHSPQSGRCTAGATARMPASEGNGRRAAVLKLVPAPVHPGVDISSPRPGERSWPAPSRPRRRSEPPVLCGPGTGVRRGADLRTADADDHGAVVARLLPNRRPVPPPKPRAWWGGEGRTARSAVSFRGRLMRDVLFQDAQWHAAARDDAIGPAPEHRLAPVERGQMLCEVSADQAGCGGLQGVDEVRRCRGRRQRHQQVNMVRRAVELDQLAAPAFAAGGLRSGRQ